MYIIIKIIAIVDKNKLTLSLLKYYNEDNKDYNNIKSM